MAVEARQVGFSDMFQEVKFVKPFKIVQSPDRTELAREEPREATRKTKPHLFDNTTLSVIVRFHRADRLRFLEEAIFSLAIQSWHDLETLIVVQNGTEQLKQAITDILDHQPWGQLPKYKILSVNIPEGVDGRSVLLNRGIKNATGRYLAFLDDDDCVYPQGYTTMIRQLMNGERAVTVGGCRRAQVGYEGGHWFIHKKDNFFAWGRSVADLFSENFVPIHSYVIDRARIGDFDLQFDESFTLLEDYDFLLRLCSTYEPDFARLDTPVCEYRVRLDGSNSIAHHPNAPADVIAAQRRAQLMIKDRKKSLYSKYFNDRRPNELTEGHSVPVSNEQAQDGADEGTRVLLKLVIWSYDFFSRYPRVERQLSTGLHFLWNVHKKLNNKLFD